MTPVQPVPADLTAWLRQQLDEDDETFALLDSTALNGIESTAGWDVRAYVERMKAEVDAKRRILAMHGHPYCGWCDDGGHAGDDGEPCTHLALLALPYADRPGYREEWKPT